MEIALTRENMIGLLWVIFFGSWVLIGITGYFYFRSNRNSKLQGQFHRLWTVGYGICFFLLMSLSVGASPALLVSGAIIVLIVYLNIKNTTFCEACGRAAYNYMWFSKVEYCAKCGARLKGKQ